jgi:hypothetical protein
VQRGISDLWPDLAMPRDISYTQPVGKLKLAPTQPPHSHGLWLAVGRPADSARDAGSAGAEIGARPTWPRQPRPTLGQLPLDQPGRAPSANLGQPQPTSTKLAEGPSKCSDKCFSTSNGNLNGFLQKKALDTLVEVKPAFGHQFWVVVLVS